VCVEVYIIHSKYSQKNSLIFNFEYGFRYKIRSRDKIKKVTSIFENNWEKQTKN